MDILSFVLGIVAVLIIAIGVIGVVAFVKVSRVADQCDNLERHLEHEIESLSNRIDVDISDIHKTIDSRVDKLQSKILK